MAPGSGDPCKGPSSNWTTIAPLDGLQTFKPCACCAPAFERVAQRLRELEAKLLPPEPVPAKRVVHLLACGVAMCGLKGVPADWPHGHTWVSFFSDERKLATCLACTRAAR